jgi:hypothetical protein
MSLRVRLPRVPLSNELGHTRDSLNLPEVCNFLCLLS